MVKKANARLQLLRKFASFGRPVDDLKDIYILFVRSILEQSATVWHSSVTVENENDLERVQKSALKIILNEKYTSYQQGLAKLGLETLAARRETLCLNLAKKWAKGDKLNRMIPKNIKSHQMNTRNEEEYLVQFANTGRLQKSPLIYMLRLLNEEELKC